MVLVIIPPRNFTFVSSTPNSMTFYWTKSETTNVKYNLVCIFTDGTNLPQVNRTHSDVTLIIANNDTATNFTTVVSGNIMSVVVTHLLSGKLYLCHLNAEKSRLPPTTPVNQTAMTRKYFSIKFQYTNRLLQNMLQPKLQCTSE